MKNELTTRLQEFFKSHSALNISKIEKEAGIPKLSLMFSVGKNPRINFPDKHWPKLEPVLRKYGWVSEK